MEVVRAAASWVTTASADDFEFFPTRRPISIPRRGIPKPSPIPKSPPPPKKSWVVRTQHPPKKSWIVKTESNVEKWRKPDPPCTSCKGSGGHFCYPCRGRGRTNRVNLALLPKGEWPNWCRNCRGSGLVRCGLCKGTGEYVQELGMFALNRVVAPKQKQVVNETPSE